MTRAQPVEGAGLSSAARAPRPTRATAADAEPFRPPPSARAHSSLVSRPGSSTCLKCAPVAIRGAGRWCALEALLRKVGSRLATESGASAHRGTRERVQRAASALEDLGGIVEIEEDRAPRGKVRLRGYSCPLASAAASHPEVCRLIESFLAEVVGAPVKECCEREGRPRCCFEIAVGRQRAA